jgi:hypothetical protein
MAWSTNRIACLAASYVGRPERVCALIVKRNSVQFGVRRQW